MLLKRPTLSCFPSRGRWKVWNLTFLLVVVPLFICLLLFSGYLWPSPKPPRPVLELRRLNETQIDSTHKTNCRFHTCFDNSLCVFSLEDIIGVHVGDWYDFGVPQSLAAASKISLEYAELVEAVKGSRYYVADPSRACIFVPPVDTLSQSLVEVDMMSVLLNSLPP